MNKQTLPQAHEIFSVMCSLEGALRELDRLGAGIAAVHANAAIEQLRHNLAIVNDNHIEDPDKTFFRIVPVSEPNDALRILSPRD